MQKTKTKTTARGSLQMGERTVALADALTTSLTKPANENSERLLERAGMAGIDAYVLVSSEPVTDEDLAQAAAFVEQNYGVSYPQERWGLLFMMITDAGWTKEQLYQRTIWLLKTKPWKDWTIADWFNVPCRVYSYGWALHKRNEGYRWKDFDQYRLPDGTIGYKLKDGIELPFPRA